MDQNSLLRLAEGGIGAFPPTALPDLVLWCLERTAATGDGRYAVVAACLMRISAPFEDVERLDTELVRALDAILAAQLPGVVQAADAETGALLAASMKDTLETVRP